MTIFMGTFIFNYMIKAKKETDDPNFYSKNIISCYIYVIHALILYSKNIKTILHYKIVQYEYNTKKNHLPKFSIV
jgi:elongation factor P hydroxylase